MYVFCVFDSTRFWGTFSFRPFSDVMLKRFWRVFGSIFGPFWERFWQVFDVFWKPFLCFFVVFVMRVLAILNLLRFLFFV